MSEKPEAKDLFVSAHRLGIKAREAFLKEACKGDAELHLEVQRMLVDSEKADAYFSDENGATLGADAFDATYAEQEGDPIGPYKLRQQIGEGGFGTVWMVEQSVPISRMVALKVIKAGMDTKQVLARFEAERQALAMMDHPRRHPREHLPRPCRVDLLPAQPLFSRSPNRSLAPHAHQP